MVEGQLGTPEAGLFEQLTMRTISWAPARLDRAAG